MPQNFISRYNNLLAVKGLGSIEYTAGPNIDISDYIISGRDWTSDIDSAIEGVKGSGFSAATAWVDSQGYLTAHQDVDNLPYVQNSALEFYGVQISGISGSGLYAQSAEGAFNAETANFAYHSNTSDSATYAESAGVADSAKSAYTAEYANSANSALISEIANYAYTAEIANNLGNWDYTDSAQTAISGYNGTAFLGEDSNCPWISGNKVIGAITADFGNTVQVISSFDFSGNKNHYISLKGFNLTLPSTANIASALDQKLDSATFDSFLTIEYSPRLSDIYNKIAVKADNSALSALPYVKSDALSGDNGLITGISGSGFSASVVGGWEFNGDNEITGYNGSAIASEGGDMTPWISGDKVIDPELLLNFGDAVQMISSFNVSGYKNHAIALKGRQLKLPSTAHIQSALDDKLDTIVFDNYTANADITPYSAGANIDITDHTISGKDWLPIIESGDSGKLDISAFENYTATAIAGDYELSAGPGISITDYPEDQKTVIAVTAGGGGGTVYSAGQYIDIDPSNYISVTGLSAYTAGSNINITNNVISGKNWTNEITAASAYAAAQATGKVYNGVNPIVVNNVQNKISAETAELLAGANITFTTAATSTTINGKDWTNEITAASAYAAAQATGKEYTGVAPIVVNNAEDKISADCIELIAGNGIEFVTASTSTTINCTAVGGSYELTYNSPSTGFTSTSGLRIAEYIGQTGSYRRLFSGDHAMGDLIPTSYGPSQYLTTNAAGNIVWDAIPDTGIKVQAVATSGQATGANILYIVTGS